MNHKGQIGSIEVTIEKLFYCEHMKAGKLKDSTAVAADIARAYDYIYEPTSLHTGNGKNSLDSRINITEKPFRIVLSIIKSKH